MSFANENTTVICQIESQEGIDNLEDIATTPGVDVLWVGHFDLSQSLGIPGQFDRKPFLDALTYVVKTAKENGLGAGIQPGTLDQAKAWVDMGFNVLSYGSDHTVYLQAMTRAVSDLRNLA
jgi:2-dehydro-3-deoxyglucarate aldolase/4-hydroxy-2-oxoheptanedioate aldolase